MNRYLPGRRDFLMTMTALGAAGIPAVAAASGLRSVDAAAAAAGTPAATAYNPAAKLEHHGKTSSSGGRRPGGS